MLHQCTPVDLLERVAVVEVHVRVGHHDRPGGGPLRLPGLHPLDEAVPLVEAVTEFQIDEPVQVPVAQRHGQQGPVSLGEHQPGPASASSCWSGRGVTPGVMPHWRGMEADVVPTRVRVVVGSGLCCVVDLDAVNAPEVGDGGV